MIIVVLLMSLNILLATAGVAAFAYLLTNNGKLSVIVGVLSVIPVMWVNFYVAMKWTGLLAA